MSKYPILQPTEFGIDTSNLDYVGDKSWVLSGPNGKFILTTLSHNKYTSQQRAYEFLASDKAASDFYPNNNLGDMFFHRYPFGWSTHSEKGAKKMGFEIIQVSLTRVV